MVVRLCSRSTKSISLNLDGMRASDKSGSKMGSDLSTTLLIEGIAKAENRINFLEECMKMKFNKVNE